MNKLENLALCIMVGSPLALLSFLIWCGITYQDRVFQYKKTEIIQAHELQVLKQQLEEKKWPDQ